MNSIARLQVIAFTCCVITTFLMVAATASTEWIKSEDWREGLFEQCVRAGAPMPMPFGGLPIPGCRRAHDAGMYCIAQKAWSHELNLHALSFVKEEGFMQPGGFSRSLYLLACIITTITTSDP